VGGWLRSESRFPHTEGEEQSWQVFHHYAGLGIFPDLSDSTGVLPEPFLDDSEWMNAFPDGMFRQFFLRQSMVAWVETSIYEAAELAASSR